MSRPPHSGTTTLLVAFVVVIVTWIGNVVLAYAGFLPFFASGFGLPFVCYRPIALGVFSVSFVLVFVALLAMTARPSIMKLVLFSYSASPLSRWAMTRGWRRRLISWYKSHRAARVCVWIKDDDVRSRNVSDSLLCLFMFPGSDPRHATGTALGGEEHPRCPDSHICPRVSKHRGHTKRAPSERPSAR